MLTLKSHKVKILIDKTCLDGILINGRVWAYFLVERDKKSKPWSWTYFTGCWSGSEVLAFCGRSTLFLDHTLSNHWRFQRSGLLLRPGNFYFRGRFLMIDWLLSRYQWSFWRSTFWSDPFILFFRRALFLFYFFAINPLFRFNQGFSLKLFISKPQEKLKALRSRKNLFIKSFKKPTPSL